MDQNDLRLCEIVPLKHLNFEGPYQVTFINRCKSLRTEIIQTREEALKLYNIWMSGQDLPEIQKMSDYPELDKLEKECDYNTKLAVTAWVFRNILDHAKEGGSYRYLIYDRLGFGLDAYVPLYEAGGMDISNEFDIKNIKRIKEIVKNEKIEILKKELGMCDEPECFDAASCGTPVKEDYRLTCGKHRPDTED